MSQLTESVHDNRTRSTSDWQLSGGGLLVYFYAALAECQFDTPKVIISPQCRNDMDCYHR